MRGPGWLGEHRDAYTFGLMRVGFAALLFAFTLKLGRTLLERGYFGDAFHMPLLPEAWVPSRAVYMAMLALQAVACLFAVAGVAARPALLSASLLGFYGFFCDRLQYHNNRYCLLLLAFLVAFSPCDRSWLLWRWRRAPLSLAARTAPRFMAGVIGAQLTLVYLSSSLGKAFDADWRGGTVMLLRFAEGHALLVRYLPRELADALLAPWFAHAASLVAIGSELFIAIGPWLARARPFALWLGVVFHLGIEVSANVELFSYTMLCGYVAFAKPELFARRAAWRSQGWLSLSSKLDWLRRYELTFAPTQAPLLVVHSDVGSPHTGLAAWRELARGIPALFPLWLPLWLVTFRRRPGGAP
jgi:hypothetical protein